MKVYAGDCFACDDSSSMRLKIFEPKSYRKSEGDAIKAISVAFQIF